MAHLYEIANALEVDARDLLVPNKYADEGLKPTGTGSLEQTD